MKVETPGQPVISDGSVTSRDVLECTIGMG